MNASPATNRIAVASVFVVLIPLIGPPLAVAMAMTGLSRAQHRNGSEHDYALAGLIVGLGLSAVQCLVAVLWALALVSQGGP